MEIERKYLIKEIPFDVTCYPCHIMEQAYISVNPVIRVRQSDDSYILTIKSSGLIAREEFELNLNKDEYINLLAKTEGNIISKTRYLLPLSEIEKASSDISNETLTNYNNLVIELDIFSGLFDGLKYAEVEFANLEDANSFIPPKWFLKDVTTDIKYHNSSLSSMDKSDIIDFISTIN